MNSAPLARPPRTASSLWWAWALLSIRLVLMVDRSAVDTPFSDQWDFYKGLTRGASWWELWDWQHGPHRMGLGLWISKLVLELSSFNFRAEAFVATGIYILSAALALALVRRLRGDWQWTDAFLPLVLLNPDFFESLLGPTNHSHGPLPTLLALGAVWLWTCVPSWPRSLLWGTWVWVAVFTGFSFAWAIPVCLYLAWDAWQERGHTQWLLNYLLPLGLAASAWMAFLVGYEHSPAVACYTFPHSRPWEYISFIGFQFGEIWGFSGRKGLSLILGLLTLGALSWTAMRASRPLRSLAWGAILFSALSAVGRVCVSETAGQVSRYMPYAALGLVALYLFWRTQLWERPRWRSGGAVLLALLAVADVRHALQNRVKIDFFHEGKSRWLECIQRTDSPANCADLGPNGFVIYPGVQKSESARETLNFLKCRRTQSTANCLLTPASCGPISIESQSCRGVEQPGSSSGS